MARILVVDDNEMNRDILERRLTREKHEVITAVDGEDALQHLNQEEYDLMLLDIQMPVLDGHAVLERMRADKRIQDTPVIVISAQQELDNVVKCIEMGAEDYLPKPFNPVLLRARINATLDKKRLRDQEKFHQRLIEEYNKELQEQVQEQVREIASSQLGAIFAMSKLAESKDPETGAHLERMREYCKLVSCQLQKSNGYENVITDEFVNNIYAASPLHDIGKVGVPDNVLLKPGKLTTDEWVAMKEHTTIGADTLRAVNEHHPGNAFLQMGIEIAECHHEKWDGSGYPKGLSNTGIPLAARILALGDVYDALTSKRCYKDAFSHEKSRGIILEGKGSHFDPDVVDAFLENEDEFIKIRSYYEDED